MELKRTVIKHVHTRFPKNLDFAGELLLENAFLISVRGTQR